VKDLALESRDQLVLQVVPHMHIAQEVYDRIQCFVIITPVYMSSPHPQISFQGLHLPHHHAPTSSLHNSIAGTLGVNSCTWRHEATHPGRNFRTSHKAHSRRYSSPNRRHRNLGTQKWSRNCICHRSG
jgi:hypothetical protein